ncbi:Ribosomal protein L35A superfamily [Fusarium oxysporum f. sp. vasinfectum]|nr:Ribosomal protein L35A superfamily [Fusarium oxysporum f. sp. vasinfectum]
MPSEAGHRLYVKGRHLSYQRSRHTTRPATSLIKIEGVDDTNAANFYLGKKVAFVYRGQKEIRGTKIRVIWARSPDHTVINTRPGNSGVVRAKFTSPLPTKSFGASVRVMLYPSSI